MVRRRETFALFRGQNCCGIAIYDGTKYAETLEKHEKWERIKDKRLRTLTRTRSLFAAAMMVNNRLLELANSATTRNKQPFPLNTHWNHGTPHPHLRLYVLCCCIVLLPKLIVFIVPNHVLAKQKLYQVSRLFNIYVKPLLQVFIELAKTHHVAWTSIRTLCRSA